MSWDNYSKYGDDFKLSFSWDNYDEKNDDDGDDDIDVDDYGRAFWVGTSSIVGSTSKDASDEGNAGASQPYQKENGEEDENAIMETLPEYSDLYEFIRERNKNKQTQTVIENRLKKEEKVIVDDICANFFYTIGLPFHVVRNPMFEVFCEAVGRYGRGYKPPSMHQLGFPLLEKKVLRVDDIRKTFESHWRLHGCTLMLDGWTDRTKRSLINFLVNCPEGTIYLYSINASDKEKTVDYLVEKIEECMKKIGEKNVVQVCTYNTTKYVLVGKKLMERHPHLYWTPCVAHCVDLILEDIGKLAKFKKVITIGQKITSLIYQDTRFHDEFVTKSDGKEPIRCGISRFTTTFLTLPSLLEMKNILRQLFILLWDYPSEETEKREQVHNAILQSRFWPVLEDCLKVSKPLLQILRLVDIDEKPTMGHISAAFRKAKDAIKDNFNQKPSDYKPILDIIDRRWNHHLDCPLFGAGAFLNPKVYYHDKRCDSMECDIYECAFQDCLHKMVEDDDLRNKILNDVEKYKRQEDRFGRKITIDRIDHLQPLRCGMKMV